MRFSNYLALGLLSLLLTPAAAQDQPRDLSIEQTTAYTAGVPRPGSLKVSVGSDRADATYAIGENARLFITANEDAYVTVFSIGPSGQVHQLFPNAYQTENRVQAGRPTEIAGGTTGARIAISGPIGAELVKVVASNKPLVVIGDNLLQGRDFFRMVDGGVKTLVRNLDVVANDAAANDRKLAVENLTLRTIAQRSNNGPVIVVTNQPTGSKPPVTLSVVSPQATGLVSVPSQQPFPLLIAHDKPVYRIGERVTLAVTSLKTCYLTVLDVTTSGAVRVLFPNQITRDNAVSANQTVLIAGGPSLVALEVGSPPGTEQVVAICSTDKAPVLKEKIEFAQLFPPGGERSGLSRDLAVVASRPSGTTAFSTTSFAVQP